MIHRPVLPGGHHCGSHNGKQSSEGQPVPVALHNGKCCTGRHWDIPSTLGGHGCVQYPEGGGSGTASPEGRQGSDARAPAWGWRRGRPGPQPPGFQDSWLEGEPRPYDYPANIAMRGS